MVIHTLDSILYEISLLIDYINIKCLYRDIKISVYEIIIFFQDEVLD